MLKKIIPIVSLIMASNTFAWFCPNNFNLIQAGDSLDKILAQCGKPISQTTTQEDPKVPQEWDYYVSVPLNPGANSSVKMAVVFNAAGIVENITVNGLSSASTGLCGGTIALGNTITAVRAACGDPPFVNKGQAPQGSSNQKIKVDTLLYNGTPPNSLIFENGILTERR